MTTYLESILILIELATPPTFNGLSILFSNSIYRTFCSRIGDRITKDFFLLVLRKREIYLLFVLIKILVLFKF